MTSVFARTREREKAWKFGVYCLAAAVILAIPFTAMFQEGPVVGKDEKGRNVHMYIHNFKFSEVYHPLSFVLPSCVR